MERDTDEVRDEVATDTENTEATEAVEPEVTEPETVEAEEAAEPEPGAAEAESEDEPEAKPATEAEPEPEPEPKPKKKEKAKREKKPLSKRAQERRRRIVPLVAAGLLAILCLVAVLLPAWGISLGTFVGGGNTVELNVSDYADGTTLSDVVSTLESRADQLQNFDLDIAEVGDDTVELTVPFDYDAATVASGLTRKGKFELVRVDSISDADALQKIENSADDIALTDGTYEAFVTGDQVTKASVVKTSYYGYTYYTLSLELNDEGTESLASVSEELADSSGEIAVVMDGTILSTPSVSEKLEDGKINISGGYTEDEAYSLAAAISTGELNATVTAGEPVETHSAFGGLGKKIVAIGFLVLALIGAVVAYFMVGAPAAVVFGSGILVVLYTLGVFTVLYRFGLLILGSQELVGLAIGEVCAIIVALMGAKRYHDERAKGASVRKAQQLACEVELVREAKAAFGLIVIAVLIAIFVGGSARQIEIAIASFAFAILIAIPLYVAPALRVITANDATKAVASGAAEDADDDSSDEE